MSDIVMNVAKGRVAELARLGAANDALIAIPLETAGLEADAILRDYDDVAALLAGTTNEQTTLGRKTLTGVAVSIDDTNDWQSVDCDNISWASATGNPVSRLLIAYDQDTTGGTDANLIPLVCLDFVATPGGGTLTYEVNTSGFYRAG